MSYIPQEIIQGYETILPNIIGCHSGDLFLATADDGNHYLQYGIVEGSQLIFDAGKPYQVGHLACFIDENKKIHLRSANKKGEQYLGSLVAVVTQF